MSEVRRMPFMGREVDLRVVPVGVILDAADMINEGKSIMEATWLTLCASAFWHDNGEQVFKDRDACRAVSGDHMGELLAMAREASDLNRPDFGPLQAKTDQPTAQANGHAEPGVPSH